MKRFLLSAVLVALPLMAQEAKKEETPARPASPSVQKLFLLKYADPASLQALLSVFPARFSPNRDLRGLAVDTSPETMAAIEDVIKRLDVPGAAPTNVDITVYMLVGHEGENPVGSAAVPKDLESVVAQLKTAMTFKNYNLMDVLAIRTRTGQQVSTSSSGGSVTMPGGATQPVMTNFSARSISIGPDGATVRIDGLQSGTKVPIPSGGGQGFSYTDLSLRTDVDVKEGQKVVLGRLGISKDQALFMVLTVKIVP